MVKVLASVLDRVGCAYVGDELRGYTSINLVKISRGIDLVNPLK